MSSNQKQGKGGGGAATYSGGMRAEAKKTKVVFKNVLDTPFNIPWPEVTSEHNEIVLDVLCDLMKPIREYHNTRSNKDSAQPTKAKKIKKASKQEANSEAKSKPDPALASADYDPSSSSTAITESTQTLPPPSILQSTVIGINAVTKTLERSIQNLTTHPAPSAVFLCMGDLAPSHLYTHLGPMIAMLPGTVVFPFLRGSERKLSEALGMQAVGALAIKAKSKEAEGLIMILGRMVEPITVSWLPKVTPPIIAKPKTKNVKKAASTASVGAKDTAATADQATSGAPALPAPVSAATTAASTTSSTTTAASSPVTTTATTITRTSKAAVSEATSKAKSSVSWVPTNIKSIKTTMPIVVKTPKPVAAPTDNAKTQNSKSGKNKSQQQQQRTSNQGKGTKHPADDAPDRGKGKKLKTVE
ncbi:hypothetical protein EDD21DRAFT_442689 [Dissophora ornata]|nr:hypothetical protein BGZ58_005148 [Dissophora ornata]KAI8602640.1 hypothetical protein EDD21DRAFT_442689 [Dissophora ornata]